MSCTTRASSLIGAPIADARRDIRSAELVQTALAEHPAGTRVACGSGAMTREHIPFTFGIPLIARRSARDWNRVRALLELTLRSILSQSDGDFRVVIAGHDDPHYSWSDPRITFLRATWAPADPDRQNSDGGRKKNAIKELVLAREGGLLMFVDADDWIDRCLVELAREQIQPEQVGAVIRSGYAIDMASLRAAAVPAPGLFGLEFDRVCGSSVIYNLNLEHTEPVRRNPYSLLHEHYRFVELARQCRLPFLELPVAGAYAVNTAENHSELHGPFTEWRAELSQRVGALGSPLDRRGAARFGLELSSVRETLRLMVAPPAAGVSEQL